MSQVKHLESSLCCTTLQEQRQSMPLRTAYFGSLIVWLLITSWKMQLRQKEIGMKLSFKQCQSCRVLTTTRDPRLPTWSRNRALKQVRMWSLREIPKTAIGSISSFRVRLWLQNHWLQVHLLKRSRSTKKVTILERLHFSKTHQGQPM